MKIKFLQKNIERAPKADTRVKLIEGDARRFVREGGVEWLEIGVGKEKRMSARRFILLCRTIIAAAKQHKLARIAIQFDKTPHFFKGLQHLTPEAISVLAATAFEMANFEFTHYKSKKEKEYAGVEEILLCGKSSSSTEKAAREGQTVGQEVNACRVLCNTPGGDMTPQKLAEAAKAAVKGTRVKVKVLGVSEMKKLKMGGILGVGKGSRSEPRFIVAEYWGGPSRGSGRSKPIVLIGKGITFDTGGLNLKPETGIYEMHMDMSGGAAVIHAIVLAAKLKVKRNIVALIPAAENMPSGESYRPGDILRSMSGKTIEILNTDAEGRVVLADAITYAKRYNPSLVVDVATLTAASLIALGQQASVILTRDEGLQEKVQEWGEGSGDYVWPLPLWDEYEDMVKGNFADVANIPASGNSRYGGIIGGAMFLWQFAKELNCPWMHIDMGSRMTAAPNEFLAKGAVGAPVRLLLSLIKNY